jgi:hypothetical protein
MVEVVEPGHPSIRYTYLDGRPWLVNLGQAFRGMQGLAVGPVVDAPTPLTFGFDQEGE